MSASALKNKKKREAKAKSKQDESGDSNVKDLQIFIRRNIKRMFTFFFVIEKHSDLKSVVRRLYTFNIK